MTNATLFETKGNIPVVTNSSLNNGISGYVALKPTEKGNMITYSDTTTSEGIFYQPRDFVGYSHIQGLYPLVFKDKWNQYTLLYMVSAFRKASFGRFDYGNKFNRNIAKELKILLPVYANNKNVAEVAQMRKAPLSLVNRGFTKETAAKPCFQGGGEGGLLDIKTQADNEESTIYRWGTTQPQIAFDFMESFIKAIQKECIKGVAYYQEAKKEPMKGLWALKALLSAKRCLI